MSRICVQNFKNFQLKIKKMEKRFTKLTSFSQFFFSKNDEHPTKNMCAKFQPSSPNIEKVSSDTFNESSRQLNLLPELSRLKYQPIWLKFGTQVPCIHTKEPSKFESLFLFRTWDMAPTHWLVEILSASGEGFLHFSDRKTAVISKV